MSKFERTINTFKNGMVSPRLRGAVVSAEDGSSAEVLENFIVDRSGAACKRPGMGILLKGTRPNDGDYYTYSTELLGSEYMFSFPINVYYSNPPTIFGLSGENPTPTNPVTLRTYGVSDANKKKVFQTTITSWSFVGTTITLTVPAGHNVFVGNLINTSGLVSTTNPPNGANWLVTGRTATTVIFSALLTPTGAPTVSSALMFQIAEDMYLFNFKQGTAVDAIDSGMNGFLNASIGTVIRVDKISDRTLLVTSDGNTCPYYISLLDYSDGTQTVRGFFKYPLFVNAVLLLENLGKVVTSAVKCPICPANYPFNPVNTDPLLTITAATIGLGQTGTAPAIKVVAKSNDAFIWRVTVPIALTSVNGTSVSLQGRFLNMPSDDNTYDVIYFLTTEVSRNATTATFNAIQVVGGTATTAKTAWKISTWGERNYPRVGNMCFGRLMLANSQLSPSQWWASAIHPDNRQYFQGMMTEPLRQDLASNISGINYAGVAIGTITTPNAKTYIADIYRFGFSDFAPSYGEIQWITSRRRVHLGTSKGECQITFGNVGYTAASYEQNQIGTSRSELGLFCQGNRRIFYVSNGTLRSISTDDKDYESVDILLSSTMQGIDISYFRIEWFEKLSCLLIQAYNPTTFRASDLYVVALDNDTQVKAFSKVTTMKRLEGITSSGYMTFQDSNLDLPTFEPRPVYYSTLGNLTGEEKFATNIFDPFNALYEVIYADFYTQMQPYGFYMSSVFNNYLNTSCYILWKNKVYPFTVGAVVPDVTELPMYDSEFEFDLGTNSFFVFSDRFKARLKTLPIFEGARFGSSVGDVQRVDRITVLIDKSGPFKYGSEEANMIASEGVEIGDTKVVVVDFPQSPDREQFVWIESDDVSPLNISGVGLRGVSYSGE